MKPPQIDQVAMWLPMKTQDLDVKTYDNYQYLDKGIIRVATPIAPVVRYAKNYTIGEYRFSLCIISLERDTEKMEKFLDEVSEKVKPEDHKMTFTKTEFKYHA